MTDSTPEPSRSPTFEEDLERLESIVSSLDEEPESLNEALDLYEEGVTIARRCLEQLEEAQLRVEELSLEETPSEES